MFHVLSSNSQDKGKWLLHCACEAEEPDFSEVPQTDMMADSSQINILAEGHLNRQEIQLAQYCYRTDSPSSSHGYTFSQALGWKWI